MKGDEIKVFCGYYFHHGIDVGKNKVIHYTTPEGKSTGKIKLRKTSIDHFSPTGIYFTVRYAEGECNSADKTVRIAEKWLKNSPKYDVIDFNCEHFARICKTNEWESIQSNFIKNIAGGTLAVLETVEGFVSDLWNLLPSL